MSQKKVELMKRLSEFIIIEEPRRAVTIGFDIISIRKGEKDACSECVMSILGYNVVREREGLRRMRDFSDKLVYCDFCYKIIDLEYVNEDESNEAQLTKVMTLIRCIYQAYGVVIKCKKYVAIYMALKQFRDAYPNEKVFIEYDFINVEKVLDVAKNILKSLMKKYTKSQKLTTNFK